MTYEEMLDEAMERVSVEADADCVPVISEHLLEIVERHRRATIWAADTAYAYGDVVQLSTRNGHRYKCREAGTSDSTAPTWPTWTNYCVVDGTVTWQEDGPDYENVFDWRAAVHACWMLKASKASLLIDTSQSGLSVSASQLQAQLRQRAMEYAPLGVA